MSNYHGNPESYIETLEADVERLELYIEELESRLEAQEENKKLIRTETGEPAHKGEGHVQL